MKRVKLTKRQLFAHYVPFYLCVLAFLAFAISSIRGENSDLILSVLPPGIFGLLSVATYLVQYRALRFRPFRTEQNAAENYREILGRMNELKWNIEEARPHNLIIAKAPGLPRTLRSRRERITVQFEGNRVLINSIFDPDNRPSIPALGRNQKNVGLLAESVDAA